MKNGYSIGVTVKKKFLASLAGGIFLFTSLIALFGFTGTMFALPLGGMGDFYVEFETLEGKGFTMSPRLGETGDQSDVPLVRNQIETAKINGLHIYKELKLPTGKWIRINITSSGPTTIEGLTQDARFIEANLQFNKMEMEQSNTKEATEMEALQTNWGQQASSVTITDAKIVTDYLFQNVVSLSGAKISIEAIDEPTNEQENEHTEVKGNHFTSEQESSGNADSKEEDHRFP
ncbi:DUF6230 family protein [Salirhabdus sp. Marseille-P4669]|uniref:DUF6230 family protein n=1 Tax=Salirhabdus sp. Marseille-P4669 TaxID=2042310 RepID=UPI00190E90AA|nr:DUF6230 family protein [Salirhabdus sp. Marseille-P4669]